MVWQLVLRSSKTGSIYQYSNGNISYLFVYVAV